MTNIFTTCMASPVGRIVLISDETQLKSVNFSEEPFIEQTDLPDILRKAKEQLNEYFAGTRLQFELELDPEGTPFQKKVWQRLVQVPYGATKSYRDIALELGSVLASRAVGPANGKNPIPIIIPCHRIIGSDGKLVGYAGGLERKKWLLLHEAKHSRKELLF
jgi:methylated-DNA-[protein]-cysteine S-methyltransferase